jgi:hypothetical protein
MSAVLRYSVIAVIFGVLICAFAVLRLRASAAAETPRVELNADNIGPRAIEDLTRSTVRRCYAAAWQTMEQALNDNRTGLLDEYFTGLAKSALTNRVRSQVKSGLHTRYQDRGHKLDAIFYSPSGDAMQLRDRAQLDIQILDGDKVIYEEPVNAQFMVLMTPGADRWLVRQIQAVPGEK